MLSSTTIDNVNPAAFFDLIARYPYRCQSCGMCKAVCKTDAIQIIQNEFSEFKPIMNSDQCVNCNQCVKACPVGHFDNDRPSVLGSYRSIVKAKSLDPELNRRGASGGVISALLKYGIEEKIFPEILSVAYNGSNTIASPKFFDTDIHEAAGPKYITKPLLSLFDSKKKSVAITCLPCHAKAVRIQSEAPFVFGLFCSKLSNPDLLKYVLAKKKTQHKSIKVSYRDGIWPGRFIVKHGCEEILSQKYTRSLFAAAFNSYLFTNSGCLYCDDYFAEKADISFGDPWGERQYQAGYYGESIVVIRSQRAKELVDKAVADGIISIQPYEVESLIKGHIKEIYNKKTATAIRCKYVNKKYSNIFPFKKEHFMYLDDNTKLNYFFIFNNLIVRSKGWYPIVERIPKWFLFISRYGQAYLLGKYVKRKRLLKKFINIVKGEIEADERNCRGRQEDQRLKKV